MCLWLLSAIVSGAHALRMTLEGRVTVRRTDGGGVRVKRGLCLEPVYPQGRGDFAVQF